MVKLKKKSICKHTLGFSIEYGSGEGYRLKKALYGLKQYP